jgi:hypothetical protein
MKKEKRTQQLPQNAVSGSIVIARHTTERQRYIASNSNFLSGDMIIKIEGDRLIFRKPMIDYEGKTYKMSKNKKTGKYQTAIIGELPIGKFEFDADESDEDCRVVYYH